MFSLGIDNRRKELPSTTWVQLRAKKGAWAAFDTYANLKCLIARERKTCFWDEQGANGACQVCKIGVDE